jgi:hypothetical protein
MMLKEVERKTRSDKKIRVNTGLSPTLHHKLQRLSIACGVPKTVLASEIIDAALNSPEFINSIQDFHGANEFRVIPVNVDGEILF